MRSDKVIKILPFFLLYSTYCFMVAQWLFFFKTVQKLWDFLVKVFAHVNLWNSIETIFTFRIKLVLIIWKLKTTFICKCLVTKRCMIICGQNLMIPTTVLAGAQYHSCVHLWRHKTLYRTWVGIRVSQSSLEFTQSLHVENYWFAHKNHFPIWKSVLIRLVTH